MDFLSFQTRGKDPSQIQEDWLYPSTLEYILTLDGNPNTIFKLQFNVLPSYKSVLVILIRIHFIRNYLNFMTEELRNPYV